MIESLLKCDAVLTTQNQVFLAFKEAVSSNEIINLSFAYQDSSTEISNQRT